MNCHDVQKFAYSYLDCEFDAREKGEFEAHLAACLPCRSAVGRDAAFRLTIRDRLQQPTPCPGLEARVRGRLDRHARNTFTRKVVLPFALAAGIAGSVVVWQADVPSHGDLGDRPEASVAQARRVQPVAMAGLAVSRRPAQVAAARPQRAAPRTQELLELRKDSGLQLTARRATAAARRG
jgi:anti-sigma factor RsiW